MSDYTVRIGTRRAKTPARDLYAIPYRASDDDGRLQCWITGPQATWAWNTGPCPCGHGVMQWAEAGYVAWHRICDRCGSHWDLHVVTIYLRPYHPVPAIVGYALHDGTVLPTLDEVWARGYTEDDVRTVTEISDPPTLMRRTDGSLWLAEMDGHPDTTISAARQYVRAMLTGDMITDKMCQHGAIYGGWAQRARFYSR